MSERTNLYKLRIQNTMKAEKIETKSYTETQEQKWLTQPNTKALKYKRKS